MGPRHKLWRAMRSLLTLSRSSRGRVTSLRTTTRCGEPCSPSLPASRSSRRRSRSRRRPLSSVPACRPTRRRLPATALGAKAPRGVLASHTDCARWRRSRSWRKDATTPASLPSQNPFRCEILEETSVKADVWRAERRCHGHGARCQLWRSLRRRSRSSASMSSATAWCPPAAVSYGKLTKEVEDCASVLSVTAWCPLSPGRQLR